MELKKKYHSRSGHVTEKDLVLISWETLYWERKVPKSKINSIKNSSSCHVDRELFPDSLVFNTANSSAVKHTSQNFPNYLSNSLSKTS